MTHDGRERAKRGLTACLERGGDANRLAHVSGSQQGNSAVKRGFTLCPFKSPTKQNWFLCEFRLDLEWSEFQWTGRGFMGPLRDH